MLLNVRPVFGQRSEVLGTIQCMNLVPSLYRSHAPQTGSDAFDASTVSAAGEPYDHEES